MTGQRLTDAQITAALRSHLPAHAQADLRDRIAAELPTTGQRRPLPLVLGRLTDEDPLARRRVLLLAAAFLVALGVAVAVAVGALLNRPQPLLVIDPRVDPGGYVTAAYAGYLGLPPMHITTAEAEYRHEIYHDGNGTVRHVYPDGQTYMYSLTRRAEGQDTGRGKYWAILPPTDRDPRQEIAAYTGMELARGCRMGWQYVAQEVMIGRTSHHLKCPLEPQSGIEAPDMELWIDAETYLVLRSESVSMQVDENGRAVGFERMPNIVVALEVGPQPPELFDFSAPDGFEPVTAAEYYCLQGVPDPATVDCAEASAPPPERSLPPIPDPVPAPDQGGAPADLDQYVAEVAAAEDDMPAFEILIDQRGQLDGQTRVYYDGGDRVRNEWHFDPGNPANPTVFLTSPAGSYESYYQDDGTTRWRKHRGNEPHFGMGIPDACVEGWQHRGVDLILGRATDHLRCGFGHYWIDRELKLVLRTSQERDPLLLHANVEEVIELRIGPSPPELFLVPEGDELCEDRC
jgi:hypothetical protein